MKISLRDFGYDMYNQDFSQRAMVLDYALTCHPAEAILKRLEEMTIYTQYVNNWNNARKYIDYDINYIKNIIATSVSNTNVNATSVSNTKVEPVPVDIQTYQQVGDDCGNTSVNAMVSKPSVTDLEDTAQSKPRNDITVSCMDGRVSFTFDANFDKVATVQAIDHIINVLTLVRKGMVSC